LNDAIRKTKQSIPGITLCCAIGAVAILVAAYVPLGAVAVAIILGILVGNLIRPGAVFQGGITYSERQVLSFAIALMGVNLNFLILRELGYRSLLLIVAAMAVTILSSLFLARFLRIDRKLALLLGIGNGVCGSSAIAATEGIIGADKEQVGLSVAIVNFLGTIGIFLLPYLGVGIMHFTDLNSGLLIGNTLQAVGQVVAAGFSVGDTTGQTATLVKMGRILMLTPVILILIASFADRKGSRGKGTKKAGMPLFIVGFFLFSLIPTLGLLPEGAIHIISLISRYTLILAMAGIGLRITFSSILRNGKEALVLGGLVFVVQIVFSTTMVFWFFS